MIIEAIFDHCRIGSLEMDACPTDDVDLDHCRIGSLENFADDFDG